jgi:hypothetical protein
VRLGHADCRVGKKASQAGQECKEMVLRSEDTLEEEPNERERLDVFETWKNSKLEHTVHLWD